MTISKCIAGMLYAMDKHYLARPILFASLLLLPLNSGLSAEAEMAGTLQKGLFEEEANHNLDQAIQAYQAVVGRFDEDRKVAAAAIFHLGECYRKQGKAAEAKQQFERVIHEFQDQQALVDASRANLGSSTPAPDAIAKKPAITSGEDFEIERLTTLFQQSPDVINGDGQDGVTPLQEAVDKGQFKVVAWLVEQKVDLNRSSRKGTALHVAAHNGNWKMAEFLLAHGANPSPGDVHGNTPLHTAAARNFKTVAEGLIKYGANVNARNDKDETPLHFADDPALAELLLSNKANVDARNKDHFTPLVNASHAGNIGLAKVLLAHGAEVNNPEGGLPLYWAIVQHRKQMVELLLKSKADPNLENGGDALLIEAFKASEDSLEIAGLLLKYGADLAKVSTSRWTPLMWAVDNRRKDVLEFLLKNGADANQRDLLVENGGSPFEEAQARFPEAVETLRNYGGSEAAPCPTMILMARHSWAKSRIEFVKDQAGMNRYTLFDALVEGVAAFPFADLSRIVIYRSSGKDRQEIPINLVNADNSLEPSNNVPLEFGDVIEIPERAHALGATDSGVTPAQWELLVKTLKRTVTFKAGAQSKEITLPLPGLSNAIQSAQVLEFLPSTSDFAHVQISRIDPVTKQQVHETVQISMPRLVEGRIVPPPLSGAPVINPPQFRQIRILKSPGSPPDSDDVWLLNGDSIEVPDKPSGP